MKTMKNQQLGFTLHDSSTDPCEKRYCTLYAGPWMPIIICIEYLMCRISNMWNI